jgi:hypothetical protein
LWGCAFNGRAGESYLWPFLAAEIEQSRGRAAKAAATARELLRLPRPDTILGRQHYKILPLPDDYD